MFPYNKSIWEDYEAIIERLFLFVKVNAFEYQGLPKVGRQRLSHPHSWGLPPTPAQAGEKEAKIGLRGAKNAPRNPIFAQSTNLE